MNLENAMQGQHRMGKAKSVAARRRFKRLGRPRKAGPREENGRLDRGWGKDETERAITEVGLAARQRLYGLSEDQARVAFAGSVVGRMHLAGTISKVQYGAAQEYLVVRNAYQRAIGAKPDFREPRVEEGGSGSTYEDFCRTARQRYASMQEVLQSLMQEVRSPAPVSALDVFVVRDIHLYELEGDLRLALNRLAKHFFEDARKAA